MAKTFHKKSDGSTVVRENGKISNNLPAGKNSVPSAAPSVTGLAFVAETVTADATSLDDLYTRFEEVKVESLPTLEELDASIQAATADLEELRAMEVPVGEDGKEIPSIPVTSLNCDPYNYEEDALLTKGQAEYLLRLEKATAREQKTLLEKAADEAAGNQVVSEFGDRQLGAAVNEGVYEPNSREWLLARTQGIGGSEKIGEITDSGQFIAFDESGRRRYLHKIFAKKTDVAIEAIQTAQANEDGRLGKAPIAAEIGNRLERTVQYEFAKNNPHLHHFEDKATRSAPNRPWHRFNVDGILEDKQTGELGVFEAKTAKDTETFEKARRGYMAQCLHNVAGAYDPEGKGPKVTFAYLVADIEGEPEQRVIRMEFTDSQLRSYREAIDRAWLVHKPEYDQNAAQSIWSISA